MVPAQREMQTLLNKGRRQRALLASAGSTLPSAQKNQYAQMAYLGWHMSIPFTTSLFFPLSFWLCTETCGLSGTAPRMATLVLQGIRLTVEKWPPTGVPKASVLQVVCVRNVLQPGETTARLAMESQVSRSQRSWQGPKPLPCLLSSIPAQFFRKQCSNSVCRV